MFHLKRLLKICATVATLLFSLHVVSLGFMRTATYDKYQTFIKSRTDYDVLFFGTSHMLNAVNPMQLWADYRIASYNLSYHSMGPVPSYWILRTAALYHKPKVAVLDILGVNAIKKQANLQYFHDVMDTFPLSPAKLSGIFDIFLDSKMRAELIFPFYSYHNRWKDADFSFKLNDAVSRLRGAYLPYPTKGMDFRIDVKGPEVFNMEVKNRYDGRDSVGMEYIRKFIAWCKQKDIQPLLIFIPYSAQENLADWKEALLPLCKAEGVPLLDLTDGIVDFDIDQYDQNSHLNPSGARKVTEAIGAYLSEHFDCDSHTAAAAYTQWHDDYEAYRSWLLSLIAQQTDFKKLLMMSNCSEVYANVTAGYGVTFDETEEKLLFKNGSDIRFTRSEEAGQTISVTVFEQGTELEVTRMTLRIE